MALRNFHLPALSLEFPPLFFIFGSDIAIQELLLFIALEHRQYHTHTHAHKKK